LDFHQGEPERTLRSRFWTEVEDTKGKLEDGGGGNSAEKVPGIEQREGWEGRNPVRVEGNKLGAPG